MSEFISKRRQNFLTENYYKVQFARREKLFSAYANEITLPDTDVENKSLITGSWAGDVYELFSLHYTGGVPCETLRQEFEDVVAAYESYQKALAVFNEDADASAFMLGEIDEYDRLLQLVGLAYLLHRRDLLPRIAKLVDAEFAGIDVLYEELLDYDLPDRHETDRIHFPEPYRALVDAMYEDTDAESVDDLQKFLLAWYPAMRNSGWHDTHLRITDTDGAYFGYWAFEAGAMAYLLELDDSEITHMAYPKDLVAWAKANEHLADQAYASAAKQILRAEPASVVPQSGYWSSPAIEGGALKYFAQGSRFPDTHHNEYGDVVWYYDPDKQSPAKPDLR